MKDLRFRKPPFSPKDQEYNQFIEFKKWCQENNYIIKENNFECWAEPMPAPTLEEINQQKISNIKEWFAWYDNQIIQAQREERMGTLSTWSALYKVNGEVIKTYSTIAELDAEAKLAQSTLNELSAKLITKSMGGETQSTSTQSIEQETSTQDNVQETPAQPDWL